MSSRQFVLLAQLVAFLFVSPLATAGSALSNAFTYQGELRQSGTSATGTFDFEFQLFDNNNVPLGPVQLRDDVPVDEGLFAVELDFGPVFVGAESLLEIRVRAGASIGSYETLSPKQRVAPAPNALYAKSATSAVTANGVAWANVSGVPAELADGDQVGTGTVTSVATGTGLTGGPITATGTVSIANLGVGTGQIADLAVTNPKLADGAVNDLKLANGAVTGPKIAVAAVITGHIADGAVQTAKISDGAVTTAKIVDAAVNTAKLADSAVTTAKIVDNAVNAAKIANDFRWYTFLPPMMSGSSTCTANAVNGQPIRICVDIVADDVEMAAPMPRDRVISTQMVVIVVWSAASPAGGNACLTAGMLGAALGEAPVGVTAVATVQCIAAAGDGKLQRSNFTVNAPANNQFDTAEMLNIRVIRAGANVGDTYAGNVRIHAVHLAYVDDR